MELAGQDVRPEPLEERRGRAVGQLLRYSGFSFFWSFGLLFPRSR
jgi:hypothetical protein